VSRINIFLIAICSLLIVSLLGYKDYVDSNRLYFVIDMGATVTGTSQVYIDTGHGYNDKESSSLHVKRGIFQKYSFPLPGLIANIKAIRFDPINSTSILSIKNARIENIHGDILENFPIQSFRPVQQISKMELNKDELIIHTVEHASDSITEIESSSFDRNVSVVDFLAQRGWIYIAYAILSFIVLISLVKWRDQKKSERLGRVLHYAIAHPKKAIIIIGLIFATASCYPVCFFGMSFVSPTMGGAVYSNPPWLPGFQDDVASEDFRGSDTGSTVWDMAPNSVVQHDSLFKYFEFPFWSRYIAGGIPLFAQGQSMIGDILHWIPVFLEGSAIGWDIKFVLAKAIFASGMGLLVFRLTGSLLAGSLIAISSSFLGFFAFRFNHPAYFVLTYAPWIVLQWDNLGRVLAFSESRLRSCFLQSLSLAVVTWLQLNAGAPKEGVITACFMHSFGILVFWECTQKTLGRMRALIIACGFSLSIILLAAPYWLLFLDALSKSFTNYDIPTINLLPLWSIIGFFDNLFFQKYFGNLTAPSVNLFVLFCMSSALLSLRVKPSNIVYGCWGLFALAMATAYGLIPVSSLLTIPFINKIQHVGNTFSVPMMILALILSGYGIRDYLSVSVRYRRKILIFSLLIFLGLWLIPIARVPQWNQTIIFFIANLFIVLTGFILLGRCSMPSDWTKRGLIILAYCFLALHVRHGMHLMTGVEEIDNYVLNPTERPDFSRKSNAIEYIKDTIDRTHIPTRVIGEGMVLFPSFNARYGLEGIVPVNAIRSKNYEKLLTLIDYPDMGWGWLRLIKSDQIADRTASLDLLGIGYIISEVGTHMPQGMELVYSDDLDVWQRKSVWPRAFYVNHIIEVHKLSDILSALLDKSHTPFATVENRFIPKEFVNNNAPYKVIPAKEYRLTNNSTRFTVEVTDPGLIVLGETYYPGDFIARLNDEKVDYVQVNEASKGIWVSKPGKYDVNFIYRPEKLNQALLVCFLGLALLLFLVLISARMPVKLKVSDLTDQ
jgi:hypothetical protein